LQQDQISAAEGYTVAMTQLVRDLVQKTTGEIQKLEDDYVKK
jgi:hypothetical protein